LQALWIDVDVLVKMMRNRGSLRFTMRMTGPRTPRDLQRTPQEILYSKAQLGRIRAMACAAVGIVADPHCRESRASILLDAELRRLSNSPLRRASATATATSSGGRAARRCICSSPQRSSQCRHLHEWVRAAQMEISDGRQTDGQVACTGKSLAWSSTT
jgi:hypothetical protein